MYVRYAGIYCIYNKRVQHIHNFYSVLDLSGWKFGWRWKNLRTTSHWAICNRIGFGDSIDEDNSTCFELSCSQQRNEKFMI